MPKKDKKPKKKLKEGNQIFNIYHYSKNLHRPTWKLFFCNNISYIFLILAKEEEKVEEKVEDKKEEVSASQ